MARAVLHADLDAFYASVEQRDDPALRGRPVLVGGGVVLAASYEARACGVRAAMGGTEALRRCPDAVVVRPRFDAYAEASRAVFAVLAEHVPVVERVSIDEAFLDVTDLDATPVEVGRALRAEVRERCGLPLSVGAASTKHLAKVLSAQAKPDGLLAVAPEQELLVLHRLPVERLWGVGPATAARLHAAGLQTVGQVAALAEEDVMRVLGASAGRRLHAVAHNRDPRPVRRGPGRRTFGAQRALGRPARRDVAELAEVVDGLAERLAGRMARRARAGRTVVLRLRLADGTKLSRSRTLPRPTGAPGDVAAAAHALLAAEAGLVARRGCTLVGVAVTGLVPAVAQLRLDLGGAGDCAAHAAPGPAHPARA